MESKLSTLALRIEVLEAYRDIILKGKSPIHDKPKFIIQTDISLIPEGVDAGIFSGDNEFDLSDCKGMLIESLIKIINQRIGDLKAEINDIMYPVRKA